jgi:hypothetical protein
MQMCLTALILNSQTVPIVMDKGSPVFNPLIPVCKKTHSSHKGSARVPVDEHLLNILLISGPKAWMHAFLVEFTTSFPPLCASQSHAALSPSHTVNFFRAESVYNLSQYLPAN